VPQVPQFALSVLALAQYALTPTPHSMSPLAHVTAHCPPEQTSPAGHELPHAPQLALSVCWLAQYALLPLPHSVNPPPHVVVHEPLEHT
jgi:hypothetical protein